MIVFDQVSKKYGEVYALKEVTFEVAPGEFVFIIGHSGAGKSTVARLLIRDLIPTSGTIKVGEYDYQTVVKREIPYLRRQIGVVYQDNRLIYDKTVGENIALSLEIIGKPLSVIDKTINELIRLTGLMGKEHLFPKQLSGGEIQRVGIARALAMDPPVLFADEPTGNLDEEMGEKIVDLLERINKSGTTVLMATHDVVIVKRHKHRVLSLNQGVLVKEKE